MSTVTVAELREALSDYPDDLEVRIVHQSNYPLQEVLGGLYVADPETCAECGEPRTAHDMELEDACGSFESRTGTDDGPAILYLVANGHPREGSPYGDKNAWDAMVTL